MNNISIARYQDPKCSRTFTPQFNAVSYYQGSLFDTHFHLPPDHGSRLNKFGVILEENLTIKQIVCEFEKEKVVGAIAFYAPNAWLMFSTRSDDEIINQWVEQMKEIKKGLPDWIYLFYDPISEYQNEAQKVYNSATDIIDGFGEMVYLKGESPRPGSKVDDEISLNIEKLAGDHKLVVSVHPEEKNKSDLENALKLNPETIFILHGWGHDDYIMQLMDKYSNLYFTLDPATFSYEAAQHIQGPEDKFIAQLKTDFNINLDRAVSQWERQIQRHPDRFLWGTDRCFSFHYSEEVSKLYEEFARAFIGGIDASYQDMVAYKNAQDIFEKGLQPQIKISNQNNQGFGFMSDNARNCAINKIGEENWNKLNNHEKPATEQERKIIDECSKQ